MTRNCLLLFTCFLTFVFPVTLIATNYYVSPSGNDNNVGTAPGQAWQTLAKANGQMYSYVPGDSILFERGGTYHGLLQVYVSGSQGQPIVFSAYGVGDRPHLKASQELTSWTHLGGEVYRVHCPTCPSRVNTLTIDGVPQRIGRYPNLNAPNRGFLNIESGSGKWHITDNTLNFPAQYWQGAEVVVRNLRWIMDRAKINNFQNNTISLSSPVTADLKNGFGYFFQNHPNTFDVSGEWSYDDGNKYVYLYLQGLSPNQRTVEVSNLSSNIITSSLNHVHFHHLKLTGSQDAAFKGISSQYMILNDLEVYGSGKNGVTINDCNGVIFENNTIDKTNNLGLVVTSSNYGIFRDNTITRTGLIAGMGSNGNGTHSAIWLIGNNNRIEHNRIDSVGYLGIRFEGNDNLIKRNFLTYGCLILDDGAGIYTWNDGVTPTSGNKIEENIILHMEGAGEGTDAPYKRVAEGIYIDDRSQQIDITKNTIGWVSDNGILIHNSRQINITQNTVFKSDVNQIFLLHDDIAGPTYTVDNCNVSSNLMVSASPTAPSLFLSTSQNDLDDFGSFNYNTHCNPFDSLMIKRANNPIYPSPGPILSEKYPLHEFVAISGQGNQSGVTDVQYPSYWIKDTLSSEIVSNSSFDFNLSDWSCWGNYNNNCNTSWNSSELDNGAMEMGFSATNGQSYVEAYHHVGQINKGQAYALTFSGRGHLNGRRLEVTLLQNHAPYLYVVPPVTMPIESQRKEYTYYFIPKVSDANSQLVFRIKEDVYKFWMDNVSLHEVSLDTLGEEFMDLLYNETMSSKTFELDKGFQDPYGNPYCSSVTLNPMQSMVLMDVPDYPQKEVYTGTTIRDIQVPVQGCEWVHTTNPVGEALASFHPNGLDFGNIHTDTYLRKGNLRTVGGTFVMNRNWKIIPDLVPSKTHTIRLYITRSELTEFLAVMPQISDVNDLTITRYSSPNYATLNDHFGDNTQGSIFNFSPEEIQVIPFKNGFYLEIATDELGEFWIGGQAITNFNAFPVEFLDFDATQLNQQEVKVTWTTQNEENASHFVIQRSLNKNFWEQVGREKATGTSTSVTQYNYLDILKDPYQGPLYYRLKQVDLDGKFTLSNIVEVYFKQGIAATLEVFPNPVKDVLNLSYYIDENESAELIIVNALGQKLLQQELDPKLHSASFSIKNWLPGIYYVQLSNPFEILVEKVQVH